jgi:hypothetical protein
MTAPFTNSIAAPCLGFIKTLRAASAAAVATLFAASALLATPFAQAADLPTPATLEQSLVGHWAGALEYRDYQSGQRFELPMDTRISLGPDGATLTRLSSFDDGPQTGIVWITSVSLFDTSGRRVTTAMVRKGRAMTLTTETAETTRWTDATHWTVVAREQGMDDEKPTAIRTTLTRDGATLTALKEVKPPEAPDSAYWFRNQTVLRFMAR